MAERKLRILVGKPGLDGHDRGAKVVARAFRDAGLEVIYTGLHQTPEQIVSAAIQEDVDCIGLSILSGAHNTLLPGSASCCVRRMPLTSPVFCGGVIPEDDIPGLKEAGLKEVFTPGTSTEDIVAWVKANVAC